MAMSFYLVVVMCLILLCVQLLLASEEVMSDQQLHPLESGFENLNASLTFSSPFYFLAVLFVLFDMELVILLPGMFSHLSYSWSQWAQWMLITIVILLTLFLEWLWSGLSWQH